MSGRFRTLALAAALLALLPACEGQGTNPFTAAGDGTTVAPASTGPPTTAAPSTTGDAPTTTAAPGTTAAPATTTTAPPATTTTIATTTTAAATTTTSGELGPEVVTLTGPEANENEVAAIQGALDALAADTPLTIVYEPSRDYFSEIEARVAAGDPPDIAFFPQSRQLLELAARGVLAPVPDGVAAYAAGFLQPGWFEAATHDGTLYGIPTKGNVRSLVWYNTTVVGERPAPATWADLLALSESLTALGQAAWCEGIESGIATGWPFTDWVEQMMLGFHGPEVYDQWVNHEIAFDSALVAGVVQKIIDFFNMPDMMWADGGTIATTPFADNGFPLAVGNCAMYRQGDFYSAFLPDWVTVGVEVDVFAFPPATAGTSPQIVSGVWAAPFSDTPGTRAVLEYLGSPEYAETRQIIQSGLGGPAFFPANNGVDVSLWEPWQQAVLEILHGATVVRPDASDLMPGAVGADSFWLYGTQMVNGDATVPEGLAAIEASWP